MKRIGAILLPLVFIVACTVPTKDNPRLPNPPKPTIDAITAQICINIHTQERKPDFWCEPTVEGHRWAYPANTPEWAGKELPAVGEVLAPGWGYPTAPQGVPAVRIPEEGAVFKR